MKPPWTRALKICKAWCYCLTKKHLVKRKARLEGARARKRWEQRNHTSLWLQFDKTIRPAAHLECEPLDRRRRLSSIIIPMNNTRRRWLCWFEWISIDFSMLEACNHHSVGIHNHNQHLDWITTKKWPRLRIHSTSSIRINDKQKQGQCEKFKDSYYPCLSILENGSIATFRQLFQHCACQWLSKKETTLASCCFAWLEGKLNGQRC